MNRIRAVAFAFFFVYACGKNGPVEIRVGHEKCAFCQMKIANEKFHGQVRSAKGKYFHFDSIECLSAWRSKQSRNEMQAWVRDYDSNRWLGSDAQIVQSAQIRSPMGVGLAAFSTRASAEEFTRKNSGKLLNSDELDRLISGWNANKVPDEKDEP